MNGTPGHNLYEILKCDANAPTDEIKKSYQSLILKYHPDKEPQHAAMFIQLNEAWNVLRDPDKRRVYDVEMMQKRFSENRIVHETVSLDRDFSFDDETNAYCRDCRCGALFMVSKEDINDKDCYLECDECSLVIAVTL